ncbi:MAG: transcription elongation factor GreA [Actinomycetota bacterium]|jgi:transcription elongation factor GreA
MAATHHFTPRTHARLTAEHYDLTTRGRIEVANKIEAARLLGDLKENGDYHAAKDEQGHMESRIRVLEHYLDPDNHVVVSPAADGTVCPGTIVTIVYEGDSDSDAEKYLVGHPEEKASDSTLDIISPESPLGKALDGSAEGAWVAFEAPNGRTLRVRILKVDVIA